MEPELNSILDNWFGDVQLML